MIPLLLQVDFQYTPNGFIARHGMAGITKLVLQRLRYWSSSQDILPSAPCLLVEHQQDKWRH